MKKFLILVAAAAVLTFLSEPAGAQPKGCEGPPELCEQVLDLNKKLAEQREVSAKFAREADDRVAAAKAEKEREKEESAAKMIAFAAVLAAALKGLLSLLRSWKPYFTTIKGKAWLKAITVVVGFVAFVATNVGMGIPWWQSLILAGGGPGAMLVHDLMDIIPVIRGKKKDLPPSDPPPPPESGQA